MRPVTGMSFPWIDCEWYMTRCIVPCSAGTDDRLGLDHVARLARGEGSGMP